MIDWLDSRPDQSGRDVDQLRRKPRRIARTARQLGEGGALLEAATPPKLQELVALLRGYRSWERAAVPAHQAFSVATADQRIVLHAAMRLAPIHPQPPPAANDDFDAITAVEQMVHTHAR